MKKIFETEAIRIMVSTSNDVYVTGKNQTCFTNEVLKSLGAEIYRLQKQLALSNDRISKAIDALESENFEDIPYNVACALGAE